MRRLAGHFRLAHELGKTLNEVMGWSGPTTHRQYLSWSEYLDSLWNEPSRTDHYIMRNTLEIIHSRPKAKARDLKDMKIKFRERGRDSSREIDPNSEHGKNIIALAKAQALARMTMKPTVIRVERPSQEA